MLKKQSICEKCGHIINIESDNESEIKSLQKDYKKCRVCGSKIKFS